MKESAASSPLSLTADDFDERGYYSYQIPILLHYCTAQEHMYCTTLVLQYMSLSLSMYMRNDLQISTSDRTNAREPNPQHLKLKHKTTCKAAKPL